MDKPELHLQEDVLQTESKTDVLSNAVQLAHDATEGKYNPFTPSMWRLYGCLWVAYLCGCLNGYDGSLMGGLNAMTTYQDYFDVYVQMLILGCKILLLIHTPAVAFQVSSPA